MVRWEEEEEEDQEELTSAWTTSTASFRPGIEKLDWIEMVFWILSKQKASGSIPSKFLTF